MQNKPDDPTTTTQSIDHLQAPAVYRGGFTVLSGNKKGKLEVAKGTLSFTDETGATVFSLKPSQVKSINVTSMYVMVRVRGGSKWNYDHIVDLSPESTKKMLEAGVGTTVAAKALGAANSTVAGTTQMMYERLAAEKIDNRLGWIAALSANGFNPKNRGQKWGIFVGLCAFVVLVAVIILAVVVTQK